MRRHVAVVVVGDEELFSEFLTRLSGKEDTLLYAAGESDLREYLKTGETFLVVLDAHAAPIGLGRLLRQARSTGTTVIGLTHVGRPAPLSDVADWLVAREDGLDAVAEAARDLLAERRGWPRAAIELPPEAAETAAPTPAGQPGGGPEEAGSAETGSAASTAEDDESGVVVEPTIDDLSGEIWLLRDEAIRHQARLAAALAASENKTQEYVQERTALEARLRQLEEELAREQEKARQHAGAEESGTPEAEETGAQRAAAEESGTMRPGAEETGAQRAAEGESGVGRPTGSQPWYQLVSGGAADEPSPTERLIEELKGEIWFLRDEALRHQARLAAALAAAAKEREELEQERGALAERVRMLQDALGPALEADRADADVAPDAAPNLGAAAAVRRDRLQQVRERLGPPPAQAPSSSPAPSNGEEWDEVTPADASPPAPPPDAGPAAAVEGAVDAADSTSAPRADPALAAAAEAALSADPAPSAAATPPLAVALRRRPVWPYLTATVVAGLALAAAVYLGLSSRRSGFWLREVAPGAGAAHDATPATAELTTAAAASAPAVASAPAPASAPEATEAESLAPKPAEAAAPAARRRARAISARKRHLARLRQRQAYIQEGRKLINSGEQQRAREYLTRALQLGHDATVRELLGLSHLRAGELWPAAHHMAKAAAAASGKAQSRLQESLGSIYLKLGKRREACQAFRAATVDPGYVPTHKRLEAQCRKSGGKAKAASDAL